MGTKESSLVTANLILKNVRPQGGELTDVIIRGGRIADPDSREEEALPHEVFNGGGAILLPGLVDAHMHLDKAMLGMAWYHNDTGPRLPDRIEAGRNAKQRLGIDVARQSKRQALKSLSYGTTFIRTHVDIDDVVGLKSLQGLVQTREELRGIVDIEIVAFPQSGMLVRPGVPALMEEALKSGADLIGGIDPSVIDRDPRAHLDFVFGLAERYGVPIDLHLHEPAEVGAIALDMIIDRTRALGMQGKVTVSHAFCLGMLSPVQLAPLLTGLAEAQIRIVTTGIPAYPTAPARDMVEAGIVVCSGSDGTRDTFSPFGNGDMIERAMFVAMKNNFYRDADLQLALDFCTTGGARTIGIADYGLHPGARADFVLVRAETVQEAIASRPQARHVFKNGVPVASDGAITIAS